MGSRKEGKGKTERRMCFIDHTIDQKNNKRITKISSIKRTLYMSGGGEERTIEGKGKWHGKTGEN